MTILPLYPLGNVNFGTLFSSSLPDHPKMGSIDPPKTTGDATPSAADHIAGTPTENDNYRKRRSSILPLEVGTRVTCRWRDSKYHPVKVIERRRLHYGGPNDYEYYVHYTEC